MHLTSGSTVESMPRGVVHDQGCHCWPHTEYAALEAARETTANVLQAMEGIQLELRQSRATEKQAVDALVETQELARATEAELRAKIEELKKRLPTDHRLCRAPGTRDRVCAAYRGHDGPHNFVLQTQRED